MNIYEQTYIKMLNSNKQILNEGIGGDLLNGIGTGATAGAAIGAFALNPGAITIATLLGAVVGGTVSLSKFIEDKLFSNNVQIEAQDKQRIQELEQKIKTKTITLAQEEQLQQILEKYDLIKKDQ